MAILFFDQSLCPFCEQELKANENIFSFPPFIPNIIDPLYKFNDNSFHTKCLKKISTGEKAVEYATKFIFDTRPINRVCIVGGNKINYWGDYIYLGLLTSNEVEELYGFNFITLDKKNVSKWNERLEFIDVATKFLMAGKWQDLGEVHYLNTLIEQMR